MFHSMSPRIVQTLLCEFCERAIKADQPDPIELSTGRIRVGDNGQVNTVGTVTSRVVIHEDCLLGYARSLKAAKRAGE